MKLTSLSGRNFLPHRAQGTVEGAFPSVSGLEEEHRAMSRGSNEEVEQECFCDSFGEEGEKDFGREDDKRTGTE